MIETGLLIIGAGPAGLSAAITARRRNLAVAMVGKEKISFKLMQAHRVDNYPGLPAVTGSTLAERLREHALSVGAGFHLDEVQSIAPQEGGFLAYGKNEEYNAGAIVLAPGVAQHAAIDGESDFLGRGVSYCATCDGMFFRDRPVAVVGYVPAAWDEAVFLAGICSHVYYFPQYSKALENHPKPPERLSTARARPSSVVGEETVTGLLTDLGLFEVAAVFIEREALPVDRLMGGLSLTEGFISVDRHQRASLPGVFAAGDCTGRPWQIARAIGEGQVAALSAAEYLEHKS